MTTDGTSKQPIASVEAHDAAVDRMVFQEFGAVVLVFRHIAVYHGTGIPYAVWSYRARLEIGGVSRVELSWRMYEHEDYVSDGWFAGNGREDREWAALLGGRSIDGIHILFGSGRSLTAECTHAHLFLEEPLDHFGDWNEPLHGAR